MKDISVTIEQGTPLSVPFGTRASRVLADHAPSWVGKRSYNDNPVIAVTVNNELCSFSIPLEFNADIRPVRMFSELGRRIYRHTLCYLLSMVCKRVYPQKHLIIGHSIGDGYYFSFSDESEVTEEIIRQLDARLREITAQDLPVRREFLPYHEAMTELEQRGLDKAALLLSFTNKPKLPLYICDGYLDISYEPLLDTTGLIEHFDLRRYGDEGMLLRYPLQDSITGIAEFEDQPVLFSVYQEYSKWGTILGVESAGRLSTLIDERRIRPFIHVSESLHDKKISQIADQIQQHTSHIQAVLVAGPSSSGKTTFTRKLGVQLKVLGFEPIMISLDDYYLPKADIPLDEEGKPDLESLIALDIEQLNQDLLNLFAGKTVEIPSYDFLTGTRKPEGRMLQLDEASVLIMEGIHGLNPGLTPLIPRKQKFQIYISPLTQLNLDDHNRISTTDNRIIRRMVRDHQFRGTNPRTTLSMWPSVHRGEKAYIFPYQNNADAVFNSALDYELSVLKPYAEPLLKTVKPDHEEYTQARRLLAFMEHFYPIPAHFVPEHSILREFIGDSAYYRTDQ